jgi:hypothetical protein
MNSGFKFQCTLHSGRIWHRPVKVVEQGTADGAIVDSSELQQLAGLGLPTTFASAQVICRVDTLCCECKLSKDS